MNPALAIFGGILLGGGVYLSRSRNARGVLARKARTDQIRAKYRTRSYDPSTPGGKYENGSHCDHTLLPSRLASGASDVKLLQRPNRAGLSPWLMVYEFPNQWGASVVCYDDTRPLSEWGENRFQMIPIMPGGSLFHSGEVSGDASKITAALAQMGDQTREDLDLIASYQSERYGSDDEPSRPDDDEPSRGQPEPEPEFPWGDIEASGRSSGGTNPGFNPLRGR